MVRYFKKVFIANRGEIACRAIRPLRELGVGSVVGYSDCDRLSLAVRMADEAVHLGPSPATLSYLDGDKIIQAARDRGCDALFPGYGFLSENADFAQACAEGGLTFIGPPPAVIRSMGDKAEARRTLAAAGLPVTPGIEDVNGPEDIIAFGEKAGYPLLIKPVAGGGGKGMQRIDGPDEVAKALADSQSLAAKAFGNDTVYVEKLIVDPRHIEFQFLVDQYGNYLHLGERECSVQRNHQKLLEEAPSTRLDPARRNKMGGKIARVMAQLGYITAGTMEFLMDKDGELYAMEVNTRIQVEHTVTEMVVHLDLIRMMIKIAAGEGISVYQSDIAFDSHAIQCRVNAEDPKADFAPSCGKITYLRQGVGPFVRNESGVVQGWSIPPYYDSLLCKICAVGKDRRIAVARMARALSEFRIRGVKTTVPLLRQVLKIPEFLDGDYDTGFLNRHLGELLNYTDEEEIHEVTRIASLVAEITAKGENPHCR